MTIVCGIDPGTATIGYGFIEVLPNGDMRTLEYGAIKTSKNDSTSKRLLVLYQELQTLLQKYNPQTAAVEKLYFQQNTTTALAVGQARGVILLAFEQANIEIGEYSPNEVKQAITGYGFADKNQMQEMTRILLNLSKKPTPDDAADALAIAITHINSQIARL
jgi:crossover junction endodeoxyribonuclease RuvC